MTAHDPQYMSGFGNEFATESLPGALPEGQNSPQKPAYGLYAEQLTGSPFTAPRATNKRSWLYRILPSVCHKPYEAYKHPTLFSTPFNGTDTPSSQLRWDPHPIPAKGVDWVDSLFTIAGNGDADSWSGLAVHLYACNAAMHNRFFYNADGEMLIVPQQGTLRLKTEMGIIDCAPGEIAVIPRGIKFAVDLPTGAARGYVCENYGQPFQLPDLGPIGANGLANPRDFLTPVAWYEDKEGDYEVIAKFCGKTWRADYTHSVLNVVAWHGNYAPYKYDLKNFNTINSVSFDHPDPSIFTVLTSPSHPAGTANVDFVIFPPRWMVAENTFRPPYFHRNLMSEFMGLIFGVYDGKESEEGGEFAPGGCSLHNCMCGHGPDADVVEKASNANLQPVKLDGTLAFMFESKYTMRPTEQALKAKTLQKEYYKAWATIPKLFTGSK
ncbi:homogentisate 1,2-dioxygenase [Micavibrio aeruginosavorus]|uniref:Homogentisate 1,2-dioxygenase n=1 Tax=Micavibrio aeruginosavorus (strain ARL-13) TaxID=856793 RepID=G2KM26_MICAA|nr:homogentisate 1,2-dioxygenase [Micavibrio aeruginosavorus]AEP09722.1 homogentisate 1,2-dioxygenase [Micavibrio aeruginosavorus ARL-13]